MTTQAPPISPEAGVAMPLDDLAAPAVAAPPDAPTAPLDAPTTEPILDSLALLDHRTRHRALSRHLAPFGHYLAFEQDGEQWLVPIDSNVTHIGRGLTADVRLEEQRVSRTHAILVRQGHHIRLLDNRSANGTFVSGRRIIATNVADGDVIRIGPVVMTYLHVT
jgi:FHA domain